MENKSFGVLELVVVLMLFVFFLHTENALFCSKTTDEDIALNNEFWYSEDEPQFLTFVIDTTQTSTINLFYGALLTIPPYSLRDLNGNLIEGKASLKIATENLDHMQGYAHFPNRTPYEILSDFTMDISYLGFPVAEELANPISVEFSDEEDKVLFEIQSLNYYLPSEINFF